MKGFKKDGKFRPTGNKSKSSLKKTDVKRNKIDTERIGKSLRNQQKKKFPDDMSIADRMEIMNNDVEQNKNHILSNTEPQMTEQESKDYWQHPDRKKEEAEDKERRRRERDAYQNSQGFGNGLAGRYEMILAQGDITEDDAFQQAKDILGIRNKKTLGEYEVGCDCKGKDKSCKKCNGKGSNTWTSQVGNKKTLDNKKYTGLTVTGIMTHHDSRERAEEYFKNYPEGTYQITEKRDKERIGYHAGHPLVIEDNGKLYEEFPDHDEEVYKQPNAIDHHRNKFSLFGDKKSDQAKASEEKIKNEGKTQKILEKQDKTQDKNNQKRAKEIAQHIRFLEKHMEGLEKKPAKFGVNANTQLENIQESRDQKRDLQAELDEINKLLEHPQVRKKHGVGKFTNLDYRQEQEDAPFGDISAKEYTGRDKKSLDKKKYRVDSPTGSYKMVTHDELVKILKKDAEADKKYGRK